MEKETNENITLHIHNVCLSGPLIMYTQSYLGLDGVSDKVRFKPVSSTTETSKKIQISFVACLDMILSNIKRITKALIRRMCRLVCAFVFLKPPKSCFNIIILLLFLMSRPICCQYYFISMLCVFFHNVSNNVISESI